MYYPLFINPGFRKTTETILPNSLLQVQTRIADAANLVGRSAAIQCWRSAKTKPLAAIQAAYQAGNAALVNPICSRRP